MRKVVLILFISLFIGMGLGIMGNQIHYHSEKELREKMILNLEAIIKGQEKQMRQLQAKLKEHQRNIRRLKARLSEQQEEVSQFQTGINENKVKKTFQDEDLEEGLEALGDKRVFFP